jgi:hypothetical protein
MPRPGARVWVGVFGGSYGVPVIIPVHLNTSNYLLYRYKQSDIRSFFLGWVGVGAPKHALVFRRGTQVIIV